MTVYEFYDESSSKVTLSNTEAAQKLMRRVALACDRAVAEVNDATAEDDAIKHARNLITIWNYDANLLERMEADPDIQFLAEKNIVLSNLRAIAEMGQAMDGEEDHPQM
ncbi:hypothetical protein MTsPCn7_19150 [Altererythrobacter sp. MTPC7]